MSRPNTPSAMSRARDMDDAAALRQAAAEDKAKRIRALAAEGLPAAAIAARVKVGHATVRKVLGGAK